MEVQGSLGESSEIFITRLCEMLCCSHDDQRTGSFLKQRISMAPQIGNAACVLGIVSDRDAFEECFTNRLVSETCTSWQLFKKIVPRRLG